MQALAESITERLAMGRGHQADSALTVQLVLVLVLVFPFFLFPFSAKKKKIRRDHAGEASIQLYMDFPTC